jgi:hypothetical protein
MRSLICAALLALAATTAGAAEDWLAEELKRMTLTYLRLAIVVLGLADGLLFRHATGAITALITIGALDIVKLGGAVVRWRRSGAILASPLLRL